MSKYLPDQILASTEGHYTSNLVVKDKLIYYTIALNLVAGAGTFDFVLGPATQENLEGIADSIEALENELMSFTQVAKDSYLDNMDTIDKLRKFRTPRINKVYVK